MEIGTAYEEVLKRTGLHDENVVHAYMYGSRVYGNARKTSDWDFILVTMGGSGKNFEWKFPHTDDGQKQFSDNLINVNFYSLKEHGDRLTGAEPSALECLFLPDEFKLKTVEAFDAVDDKVRQLFGDKNERMMAALRHSFSAKASNSWVKAKKKLTVEKDYNDTVGKKSLWHSIRLMDFGRQIAEHGSIVDYGSCNHIYDEVMYWKDWTEMYDKYKKMYNEYCTEFRKLAPKV